MNEIDIALSEVCRVLAAGCSLLMTVPSALLLDGFPPRNLFESIGIARLGKKLLDEYNKKQAHRNILSLNQWEKLLNEAGLRMLHHFYLFDESSYKIAMLCDWLLTLRSFSFANHIFGAIVPCWARKAFWRRILKETYLRSTKLEKGGELTIIAEK